MSQTPETESRPAAAAAGNPDAVRPPLMCRPWYVAVLAVLIFGSGVMVGGGLVGALVLKRTRELSRHPEEAHARVMTQLTRSLGLSDVQKPRVAAIIQQRKEAIREFRRGLRPQIEANLRETADQIEKELTAEQAAKWRQIVERFRENWLTQED